MSSVKVEYANASNIGKVRSENQDYFGAYEVGGGYLFIVCDGMGGHEGGSEASRIAVEEIKEYFMKNFDKLNTIEKLIENAVLSANEKIYKVSKENNYVRGMGTTVVLVFIKDDKMYYAHVGDSRIYLFRNNELKPLTEDHTLVHQLVKMKKITEEEAEKHPARHQLLQALGIEEKVFVEIAREPLKLQNNDYILLCSDGLHGYVKEDIIANIIADENKSLMEKVEDLINSALDTGGYDNVTVQLIKITTKQVSPEKKNLKKNIILGSVGIITLLSIITAVYFITRYKNIKKENTSMVSEDTVKKQLVMNKDTTGIYEEEIKSDSLSNSLEDSVSSVPLDEEGLEEIKYKYEIKKGEALSSIAERFCVSKKKLLELNNIDNEDNIKAGQELTIPILAEHKVKEGDVLSKIAEKYKVPLKKIKEINKLQGEKIKAGQVLIIPKCEN